MARQVVERYDLNTWLTRQIGDINKILDRAAPQLASQGNAVSALAVNVG